MNAIETSTAGPMPPQTPRTSRLAVASLVLGLLGFLILPAVAGLICGIIAIVLIQRNASALKGSGIAVAGTVVSGVMLALVPVLAILLAMLLPALAKAKGKAQMIQSMNNLKQITLAMHLYADASDGALPEAGNWCDALTPYVGGRTTVFRSAADPNLGPGNSSSYAFNSNVAGQKLTEVPPDTVLVFETEFAGWNSVGGPELAMHPKGGRGVVCVGFADGHAEGVTAARVPDLRWSK